MCGKRLRIRLTALVLMVGMVVSLFHITALSDNRVELQDGNLLNGWQVDAYWGNGRRDIDLNITADSQVDVKMTVEYYAPVSAMTATLNPGEVKFVIPDIGSVRRSGRAFEAITAANQLNSEWNCEYDLETESYVFTNKNPIEGGKPISGGFELMWKLKSRECTDDFLLEEHPLFYLKDQGTRMESVRFHMNTGRDYYQLALIRNHLSFQDFSNPDINKDDYITYQYKTRFNRQLRSRAGDRNTYFVCVSFDDSVTDEWYRRIIVQDYDAYGVRQESSLTQLTNPVTGQTVWGFYVFEDYENSCLTEDDFILSFPKQLAEKESSVDSYLIVHYLDEDEAVVYSDSSPHLIDGENLHGHTGNKITSYRFIYGKGNFSMSKMSDYEQYTGTKTDITNEGNPPNTYSQMLLARNIYNNSAVTFKIGGRYRMTTSTAAATVRRTTASSASTQGEIDSTQADLHTVFDFVLGDDRLSIMTNSGDFRMVESDEYTIRRVLGPRDANGDHFNYPYDLYVSNVGYTKETGTVARNFLPDAKSFDPNDPQQLAERENPAKTDYLYYGSGYTGTVKTFDFTHIAENPRFGEAYKDGVKAFYIVVHQVKGDYSTTCYADISFSFNQDRELALENEGERIATDPKMDARINNIGYMRAFRAGESRNLCAVGTDSFAGGFVDNLIRQDAQAYNENYNEADPISDFELLYHATSAVYLRDLTTALTSGTHLTSTERSKEQGRGYDIHIRTTGSIIAEKDLDQETPGELEKFSLYVRIPPLLKIDPELSGVQLVNCSATDIFGQSVNNNTFTQNVAYQLHTLPNGDRIVAANFDFSDYPLEISKLTSMELHIPAKILHNDLKTASNKSVTVFSYTMLQDKGVGQIEARNRPVNDTDDFNGNHVKTEIMASSFDGRSYESIVEEWQDTTEKLVKASSDVEWSRSFDAETQQIVSHTAVNAYSPLLDDEANRRAEYSYRLSLDIQLPTSDIVFADDLEQHEASEWHGTLRSIDVSYAASLGLTPEIYYSTQEKTDASHSVYVETDRSEDYESNLDEFTSAAQEEWSGSVWYAPANNHIRSIVIRLKTDNLPDGTISRRQIYCLVNMTAPVAEPREMLGTQALNEHLVYYTEKNLRKSTKSNKTSVELHPAVLLLKYLKVDKKTRNILPGAVFSFYTQQDENSPALDWRGEVTAQQVTVNNLGELIVDTLEPGQLYYYREVQPPAGYRPDEEWHVLDLRGDGAEALSDHLYQREDGTLDSRYVIENERLTGTVLFTKKDLDDGTVQGIAGAAYTLYTSDGAAVYTDEQNEWQESDGTKNTFVTDADGRITITGLPWGSYYLKEIQAPPGYELNETPVLFHVYRYTNQQSQEHDRAITVQVSHFDTEKTAHVRLIKTDRTTGAPLQNAWFALERKITDGEDEAWKTVVGYEYLKTGKNGTLTVEDLKFGTYRFREINAPKGYLIDSQNPYSDEVTLDASTVGKTLTVRMTNERLRGSATLTKYSDGDQPIPLNGAVFNLYMVLGEIDGTPGIPDDDPQDAAVRLNLRTETVDGRPGMLRPVKGLEWGRYYFREVAAPVGYEKDEGIYSFEITAENAAIIYDDIKPVNPRKTGEVILTKTAGEPVDVNGEHYDTGSPVAGASFVLCKTTGERLWVFPRNMNGTDCYEVCSSGTSGAQQEMLTDSDGRLHVCGLQWGSYYLEEITPPPGFALAEKVRFTVNAGNCLSVQELECEDMAMKCLIRIDKQIDRKLSEFGTPTFLFKVHNLHTGADYTATITLGGDSLSGSATLQVDPGEYHIEELPVGRYQLVGTEYVEEGTTTPIRSKTDKAFTFTLSSENLIPHKAEVKFTNRLKNYSGLSHNAAAMNIVPDKRKITGFSLALKDEFIECSMLEAAEPLYELTVDDLTGRITYDDGTSEEMTPEQLARVLPAEWTEAHPVTVWTVDNGYRNAGQSFTRSAHYTDSDTGKTYKTSFIVTIGAFHTVETQKVIFHSDESNSTVFMVDGQQSSVNVVYYNEDLNGHKLPVSGKYVIPKVISGDSGLRNWRVIGGAYDGELLSPTEEAVTAFLKEHYEDGLRELEIQIVLGDPVFDFDQKNEVQVFRAPMDGIYFLEGWGAQGGNNGIDDFTDTGFDEAYLNIAGLREDIQQHYGVGGGRGGYSYGYVYLTEGEEVYIAVGGAGKTAYNVSNQYIVLEAEGGFNGGSKAYSTTIVPNPTSRDFWGSGGGATSFAIHQNLGELSNYANAQDDVLLVAGGGGGSGQYSYITNHSWNQYGKGGYGGGQNGGVITETNHDNNNRAPYSNSGGGQNGGGSGIFGEGLTGRTNSASGAGGGWYGGVSNEAFGASGGSGHVNEAALITGATIGGNQSFKSPGGSMETGHAGDGHARITYISNGEYNLSYSATVNSFTAPVAGYYKLEGWGAAGGSAVKNGVVPPGDVSFSEDDIQEGGRGGYSSGLIYLNAGQTIYYAVGGMGNNKEYYNPSNVQGHTFSTNIERGSTAGGFNGGGNSNFSINAAWNSGSGGGATHFALHMPSNTSLSGVLKDYASQKDDVLLVAGGGGGSGYYYCTANDYKNGIGGAGGGEVAQSNYNVHHTSTLPNGNTGGGGSQTAGGSGMNDGSFGQGGGGGQWANGGGGGYYGGAAGQIAGGGGGSGFIAHEAVINGKTVAGNTVAYNADAQTVIEPQLIPTHPGAVVDNGRIVGVDSTDTEMIGNRGDGYARVTYLPYTAPIDYIHTEQIQTFTASVAGYYKLEAWGAQGGSVPANDYGNSHMPAVEGGRGGYSYGTVYLEAGQTIYLGVGGEGSSVCGKPNGTYASGGFNGGGKGMTDGIHNFSSSGGGATHFALASPTDTSAIGVLKDYAEQQDDVLLVAGGGGGSYNHTEIHYWSSGGFGGGEQGGDAVVHWMYPRTAALNNAGGSHYEGLTIPGGGQTPETNTNTYIFGTFGQGVDIDKPVTGVDCGGGGGWYGGAHLNYKYGGGGMAGGGGSGHCNGEKLVDGYGYATIGGDQQFEAPDGTMTTGNTGDGHARVTFIAAPEITEFNYTGSVQTFTATKSGKYRMEAWGAGGGSPNNTTSAGGKGGYTMGTLTLEEGERVYVYVGGEGSLANKPTLQITYAPGGFNGGGGARENQWRLFGSGGGATDFRLVRSDADDGWSGFDSLKSRIMVAGGGGGGMNYNGSGTSSKDAKSGSAGGLVGFIGEANDPGYGYTAYQAGTQTGGGYTTQNADSTAPIGKGCFGYAVDAAWSAPGGGGGYYGGGTASHTTGTGGGSSFISGYPGCDAISAESTEDNIVHTGQPNHYSGRVFSDTVMLDGESRMPSFNGQGTMNGNRGNGHARITYVG